MGSDVGSDIKLDFIWISMTDILHSKSDSGMLLKTAANTHSRFKMSKILEHRVLLKHPFIPFELPPKVHAIQSSFEL